MASQTPYSVRRLPPGAVSGDLVNQNFDAIKTALNRLSVDLSNGTSGDVLAGSFNYAELRLTRADEGDVANVYGRSTAGDGGAGQFVFRLGVATDNGGTILVVPGVGYWERVKGLVTPEMFGAVGDGVVDDHLAIQAALDAVDVVTLTETAVYQCVDYINGVINPKAGNKIIGRGATILNGRIYANPAVDDLYLENFTMSNDPVVGAHYFFDMTAARWTMLNLRFTRAGTSGTGGLFGYIRGSSSYGKMIGCTSDGSNGVYITGHDHAFVNNHIVGNSDDAYVIGSDDNLFGSFTYNITITGGSVTNNFSALSIGTGVGTIGADSTVGTRGVRNVTITGVALKDCFAILYLKPGLTFDYRNGLVEDVHVSNCTLTDRDGTTAMVPILIRAAKGSLIRNIRVNNCSARIRCANTLSERAAVLLAVMNEGNAATIRDVFIDNLSVIDIYEGQSNDVSRPGEPLDFGIKIENAVTGFGTIENINVTNSLFDGADRHGVYIGDGLDGCLSVRNTQFRNVSRQVSATVAGVYLESDDIELLDNSIGVISNKAFRETASLARTYDGEAVTCFYGTVAAGVTLFKPIWQAPCNAYVWKVEVVNTVAIAQSDINYSTYEIRNLRSGGVGVTCNTKVTGGINVTAGVATSMTGAFAVVLADAFCLKGDLLQFEKTDFALGQPTQDMIVVVHYVQY